MNILAIQILTNKYRHPKQAIVEVRFENIIIFGSLYRRKENVKPSHNHHRGRLQMSGKRFYQFRVGDLLIIVDHIGCDEWEEGAVRNDTWFFWSRGKSAEDPFKLRILTFYRIPKVCIMMAKTDGPSSFKRLQVGSCYSSLFIQIYLSYAC